MGTIKWSDDFSVNNKSIDSEHQSLFNALNQFYEGIRNNASKESMELLLSKLIEYARVHFKNEEVYMKQLGFPGLESHALEHEAFIKKAEEFSSKFKEGKLLLSVEVTNFIKDWITNHIKKQDKQYSAFVEKRGADSNN